MILPCNPFIFGPPVHGDDFLDRRSALRRVGNAIWQGGSAVVSAEPRMGKTSLLYYVQEQAMDLFGADAERWAFRYLDGHTFVGWDVPRFWREALRPVKDVAPHVQRAYAQAEQHAFDPQALEDLFRTLKDENRRLVLLVDEFDAVLREPGLHHQRFYGPLRSLASRYDALSLVLSTRQTVTDLNASTADFAAGSPFFNFAQEVALPPFPQRDVDALLKRAGDAFTPDDRAFLQQIAGRHPYFLQAVAYFLWEARQAAKETGLSAEAQREAAVQEALAHIKNTLADIWRTWTPAMRMAFTIVALDNVGAQLLEGHDFDIDRGLLREIADFRPELDKLVRLGFLKSDDVVASGYAPEAWVMVMHLADELTRALRSGDEDLGGWLSAQAWDGLMTRGEKKKLARVLKQTAQGLRAALEAAGQAAPFIKIVLGR